MREQGAVAVLGVSPVYRFPNNYAAVRENPDRYIANHGGSLVTRSICKQFSGDYFDSTVSPEFLNLNYDYCILALTTHLDPYRNVSRLACLVSQLDMPVVIMGVGVTAYQQALDSPRRVNESFDWLLREVLKRSSLVGVRGAASADHLRANGFANVTAIGCPTLFRNGVKIVAPELSNITPQNLTFSYHFSAAHFLSKIPAGVRIVGQDYHDEIILNNQFFGNRMLAKLMVKRYGSLLRYEKAKFKLHRHSAECFSEFETWYKAICQSDFVFGPRLHAGMAALGEGIPAALVPHDLRVLELCDYFHIPKLDLSHNVEDLAGAIKGSMDFSAFNTALPDRAQAFLEFVEINGLPQPDFAKDFETRHGVSRRRRAVDAQCTETTNERQPALKIQPCEPSPLRTYKALDGGLNLKVTDIFKILRGILRRVEVFIIWSMRKRIEAPTERRRLRGRYEMESLDEVAVPDNPEKELPQRVGPEHSVEHPLA